MKKGEIALKLGFSETYSNIMSYAYIVLLSLLVLGLFPFLLVYLFLCLHRSYG